MEREGGDITAADMIPLLTEPSQIQNFYADSTILVTGGTGFLGRLLIEKLLRSCQTIRKIYILIRPKDGMSCEQRYENYFEGPVSKYHGDYYKVIYVIILFSFTKD